MHTNNNNLRSRWPAIRCAAGIREPARRERPKLLAAEKNSISTQLRQGSSALQSRLAELAAPCLSLPKRLVARLARALTLLSWAHCWSTRWRAEVANAWPSHRRVSTGLRYSWLARAKSVYTRLLHYNASLAELFGVSSWLHEGALYTRPTNWMLCSLDRTTVRAKSQGS